MSALFEIRELSKYFKLGTRREEGGRNPLLLKAVDSVSFDVLAGECLGIVGESGSGKSTLGRLLLNMISPTSGQVLYDGQEISALKPESAAMKKLRGDMQMVFQNPRSSFNPKIPIVRSLHQVARLYGLSEEAAEARIRELFALTGLGQDILTHRNDELSGGQLQRLAIVRALIPGPRFLMADEAVSALDVSVRAQILELFRDMQQRLGLTVFFVSHDLSVVEYLCDRILVLYLGKILESAPADELFARPLHPYTRSLLAARPRAYPEEVREEAPLAGEIPGAVDLPPGCRFSSRCPEMVPGLCDFVEPADTEVSPGHKVACHLLRHCDKIEAGGAPEQKGCEECGASVGKEKVEI